MSANIPNKEITLESIREMFANIAADTDWDMSQPLLWGHYFSHHTPSALEEAIPALMEMGLNPVDIFKANKADENEPDLYWLQMDEVRAHTPESLDKRNDEFYLFAAKHKLDAYDGMDVGPLPEAEEE
jgi:hypothetical protein